MRVLAGLIALAACSSGKQQKPLSSTSLSTELRLTLAPRVVGTVLEEEVSRKIEATANGNVGKQMKLVKSKTRVLAVDDGLPTKLSTYYSIFIFDQIEGDRSSRAPDIAGHTYIVTRGDPPQIERDDGVEMTDAERAAVRADHDGMTTTPQGGSEGFFASRPWRLGEKITLDRDQRMKFNPSAADGSTTLTLAELTADVAIFDVDSEVPITPTVRVRGRGRLTIDRRSGRMIKRIGTGTFSGDWTGTLEEEATWKETRP